MRYGYSEVCLAHDTGERHPESPDRLRAIRQALARRHGVDYVEADPATRAEAEAVHDAGYLDQIHEFCDAGGGEWDQDTFACESTWDAALAAAGQARWAALRALDGDDGRRTPFALGRPPGHHAVVDDAMGFCFLNNAAIAAEAALDAGADRVTVFDWDVHHGNGTQDVFYDRADVFYASVHETGLYPGTGGIDETGEGAGEGWTCNLSLSAGADDADYLAAVDRVIAPLVRRHGSDLLLVSAGFDAHRHDPISRMRLSTEGFAALADRMREAADAAGAGLGFVLEGGYGLETLSEGVAAVHETFDGRAPVAPDGDPDDGVSELLDQARDRHEF
jgi:Deacetylases, including yeast histone deacetylase and acetoin utilization protein